jgi:hypothetical protein
MACTGKEGVKRYVALAAYNSRFFSYGASLDERPSRGWCGDGFQQ